MTLTVAGRKKALAEVVEIVEKAKRGYIPVSGFISPGEKEVLRRLKAELHVRFVRLMPFALPPRFAGGDDARDFGRVQAEA